MSIAQNVVRVVLPTLIGVVLAGSPDALGAPPTSTSSYSVVFQATWSAQTHPQQFPPGPHFSGLIGATHDGTISLWDVGQLASPGIQNMAEVGSKTALTSEINAQVAAGRAGVVISGGGISPSPGSVGVSFTAALGFSRVSLVSMIAPSPDWFIGVSGLDLLANGDWVQYLEVDLLPYDAGTDSGPTYTSPNQPTSPQVPIASISGSPFTPGVPLGTFIFQRTDSPNPWSDLGGALAGTLGAPSLTASGTPAAGQAVTLALSGAPGNAPVVFVAGLSRVDLLVYGGLLVPAPDLLFFGLGTSGAGALSISGPWPAGVAPGTRLFFQEWINDPGGPFGFAASNALCCSAQ